MHKIFCRISKLSTPTNAVRKFKSSVTKPHLHKIVYGFLHTAHKTSTDIL
jgi:hypothetical protein